MSFKGLQQHCYNIGFQHAQPALPDLVSEAIDALPCTLVPVANRAYAQGIVDGYKAQGIELTSPPDKTKK